MPIPPRLFTFCTLEEGFLVSLTLFVKILAYRGMKAPEPWEAVDIFFWGGAGANSHVSPVVLSFSGAQLSSYESLQQRSLNLDL